MLRTLLSTVLLSLALGLEEEHPYPTQTSGFSPLPQEQTSQYWQNKAQDTLAQKLQHTAKLNTARAKNIILFLGDGMSVHTITATRAFGGDSSEHVYFEKFPYTGLSRTYAIDRRVPDSANTATAYLSGVKGNYGTVGVNAQVRRSDCSKGADTNTHTESLAKWAQDAGKWAGLVTTARVTHASPAGVYAHTPNRNWEYDGYVKKSGCSAEVNLDIARQLVEWPVGRDLHVVLGGGRQMFRDETVRDEEGQPGLRTDKRDLIQEWLQGKQQQNSAANYVWSRQGLMSVNYTSTDYLLGLFSPSHCPYHGDLARDHLQYADPTLTEMTAAAIKILSKNQQGYFLFVEGAKIDMAHHSTRARKSLEDTAEFARAVKLARESTNETDTLIVVTSDHSHTMTINGYVHRRENILGLAPSLADDKLPYTILSYANGPGYSHTYSTTRGRRDLSQVDFSQANQRYMATVPLSSETHGGEDVGIFASGPYEHYFTGNLEQSIIPAIMAHAANIGPFSEEASTNDI